MLQWITKDAAIARNRTQRAEGATATDFIGQRGVVSNDPLAFLVFNQPNFITPPHLHDVNQFQLFVQGTAKMGTHTIAPGALHYAEHGTPYGPIVAGDEGLSYFTVRPTSPGRYFEMPGAMPLMNRKTGRTFVSDAVIALPERTAMRELFQTPDGLSAFETRATPDAQLPLPEIDHGGAFIIVMAGDVRFDSKVCPEGACFSMDRGDELPRLISGPNGAAAIFMSFPRTSTPATPNKE